MFDFGTNRGSFTVTVLLSAMYLRPMPHAPEWLADESFPHGYHQHPA
jgi:hypothetical protein